MYSKEFIKNMSKISGVEESQVELVLNSFIEVVTKELKNGGNIQIPNFGTFQLMEQNITKNKIPMLKVGKNIIRNINDVENFDTFNYYLEVEERLKK